MSEESGSRRLPFEEISPWVRAPEDRRPALEGDLDADVAVVGGGYTGLASALALRAQGADVVLLERGFAGSGASGATGGGGDGSVGPAPKHRAPAPEA